MTEPTTRTIKASEARQHFASLLNDVYREQERVVIEKSGIPVAVLVPYEDLPRLMRDDEIRAERRQFLESFRNLFKDADPDELQREIDRGVEEVRAEMRAEREAERLAS